VEPARIVDELAAEGGRAACTDAERRAARLLARHLKAMGRQARLETLWVRPQWAATWLLHAVLGIAGSVISVEAPAIGLGLAAFAAVSALAELNGRIPVLSLLWPRRATQNVVSRGPGDAPVRLLVAAPYGAPRARTGFVRALTRLDRLLRGALGGHWPHGLGLLTLALVAIAGCCGARLGGVEGNVLGAVQFVPTIVCIGAVAVLADLAFARRATGRNADASAAAVALALVDALDRRAPHRLAVDVVLAGAADGPALGMRGYVRSRRRETRAEEIAVLEVLPAGHGSPIHRTHAGPLVALRLHPRLRELAAGRPVRGHAFGGALEARRARWPAIAIGALTAARPTPSGSTTRRWARRSRRRWRRSARSTATSPAAERPRTARRRLDARPSASGQYSGHARTRR
jgi:hypothetical protein